VLLIEATSRHGARLDREVQAKGVGMASNYIYKSIQALYDAIKAKELDTSKLTLYLDAGEVMVYNGEYQIYSGFEREALVVLFEMFLHIKYVAI
jgi:hypothetical protein